MKTKEKNGIIIQTSKNNKYKFIKESKYFINRNTPIGEDADYYERKPFGGKKHIPTPIVFIKNGQEKYRESYREYEEYYHKCLPRELIDFVEELKKTF